MKKGDKINNRCRWKKVEFKEKMERSYKGIKEQESGKKNIMIIYV